MESPESNQHSSEEEHSSEDEYSIEEETRSSPKSKSKKRKEKGPTTLPDLLKDRSSGVRQVLQYNQRGSIGLKQPKYASYLGVSARNMVPISYEDWHEVPGELKDKLWSCVEVK